MHSSSESLLGHLWFAILVEHEVLLPRMPLQKLQSLVVKLFHLLIYGGMSAAFEDDEFSPLNVGLHPIGKASGREHVVPAKRYLRRGCDLAEMRLDIMRNHRMRLSHKASNGYAGRPRTNAAIDWMYSGFAA